MNEESISTIYHKPVLLNEALQALAIQRDGLYVDGTFGRGGHAQAILAELSDEGRLLGVDKDPEAIVAGQILAQRDRRFSIVQASIKDLARIIEQKGWLERVNGVLLDLGVSSPQLEDTQRGFSFLRDGPLDMRMNPDVGMSAARWLAHARENEIIDVLKNYGEERYYRRIARAIVQARKIKPLTRTKQLAEVVAKANPNWEPGKHPATRSFQAIRIFINNELEELGAALEQAVTILAVKGRLAVISFHSLEDRIVKRFFKHKSYDNNFPLDLPIMSNNLRPKLEVLSKPIKPNSDEIIHNPRARSSKLRVAKKIAHIE
ncbi:S-adenosyl-methyltransferase MraW [Candidatus Nitrosoglobus terrae]|uniref:Ribosomal RNA small subunit methyltransferase H n=1 Tax=Candidatus Nitrosoglobus terrae TaxID=1630141 RepID=A0A1Q2SKD8_9GAMM|nr:16S rRNA (cytosine(1402)-N(4))-methyltransferase RsmH [Candidatus Nitrosoglobus terrae]BAW79588.1 S-adenosyl-methyltransferase MraW [Candidatus Nitrosoglobus terrae]